MEPVRASYLSDFFTQPLSVVQRGIKKFPCSNISREIYNVNLFTRSSGSGPPPILLVQQGAEHCIADPLALGFLLGRWLSL